MIMKLKYQKEKAEIVKKLTALNLSKEQAEVIADCFATADEWGVTSHGERILPAHIDKLRRGGYNLNPNLKIIRQTAAFALVDGDNAFGPVSATFCMNLAMENAKKVGVFQVFSRNNNTVGPAFYYPLKAAEQGLIGILFSNSPAQMAPYGGKEKMLGTNPFSAVIPVPGYDPIVIDMATSIVAKSKFKQYKEAGKQLPDGWALDENGKPTNDPDEGIVGRFYSVNNDSMNVGFCCIAIDPKIIMGDNYDTAIVSYVNELRNSQNVDDKPIILPGDDRIAFMRADD